MCESCGCSQRLAPPPTPAHNISVDVHQDLLAANDAVAERNRALLNRHGVLALNLMSAPGSGKTSLLEATCDALRGELRVAVIEGDLATENDARRLRAKGVPALQICTGNACHLDAPLVANCLRQLPLAELDIVFIENVGNLVCPAAFDLGQHRNVTLLSVTEGDDKPAKYPVMFRASDLLLISKCDLLPVFEDFSPQRVQHYMHALASAAPMLQVMARREPAIDTWLQWLRGERAGLRHALNQGRSPRPGPPSAAPRRRQTPAQRYTTVTPSPS